MDQTHAGHLTMVMMPSQQSHSPVVDRPEGNQISALGLYNTNSPYRLGMDWNTYQAGVPLWARSYTPSSLVWESSMPS